MKCVVLAAGAGKRLHPFTRENPKPMMPVLNKPILEHIFASVRKAGIDDVLVNLHHEPEKIINFFKNGEDFGIKITWRTEPELTGPAGALLIFEDLLKDEEAVLVLSGDGIHDIDLLDFINAHKVNKAPLSVVMQEVVDPGRYGVGRIDKNNRIVEFVEKPLLPKDARGLVSCGIYCIDPKLLCEFPRGCVYDYGQHLIPARVASGKEVYCYQTHSYWSDIGTAATLLDANLHALTGKVKLNASEKWLKEGVHVGDQCSVDPSVKLISPVMIGSGTKIESGVEIVGPVVIGQNSVIEKNAYIQSTVLFNHSHVPKNSVIVGGLIG